MDGYNQIALDRMIQAIGEDRTKLILSSFSCSTLNKDVEYFLHHKAIEFSKQSITKTQLIFVTYKDKPILVGYYALTQKIITISNSLLSKTYKKRISKFAHFNHEMKVYSMPTILIAQMGKNYANGYEKLIRGDELLKLACDQVKYIQTFVGGRTVYLECEEKQKLLEFYDKNGFTLFGKRRLDKDETDMLSGEYLAQLLRYLNP